VPYGELSEVMPYLGRRAIENKSVLGGPGGAAEERRRVGRELWKRILD
jgi:proline dehydrogenase